MLENPQDKREKRGDSSRGFTLLEVMIVMVIIIILATIAVGQYQKSIQRSKEAVLHQDLQILRNAINSYWADKDTGPGSLDDLKTSGYIGDVPEDPITRHKDWVPKPCDESYSADATSGGGICDVTSSSDAVSPFENTAYNTW